MSTILTPINRLLYVLGIRKHKFGVSDAFRVVEQRNNMPAEHMDWSIKHGGFDNIPYKGQGERIAVLDTGVDPNHKDLKGKVTAACFIENCSDSPAYKDNIGHGTFCCGEIVAKADGEGIIGVAPEATCLGGKVLYGDGRDRSLRDFEKYLANGIKASIEDGCGVISMSLGTSFKSPIVGEAVTEAVEAGVLVFAAAGNEGLDGSPYASYPASYKDCISVAASDRNDFAAWFSTEGCPFNQDGYTHTKEEQPEMAVSSLEYYWGCIPGSNYGKMIGTSMACPMAAGVAILWRQAMREANKLGTGREVLNQFRSWLRRVANDTNKNGWDPAIGYGVLLIEDGEMPS